MQDPDPRLLLSVPEAARRLSVGKTATWELVHRGELAHVRIGRRVLIPVAALEDWIARATARATQTPEWPVTLRRSA